MKQQQKDEITKISKEFASGFKETIGEIAGSGWLIADPLSGYLNHCGFTNKPVQLPADDERPQILILVFEDGDSFIPAGSDLPFKGATDWLWINDKDLVPPIPVTNTLVEITEVSKSGQEKRRERRKKNRK